MYDVSFRKQSIHITSKNGTWCKLAIDNKITNKFATLKTNDTLSPVVKKISALG
jgi:hypothetical protein